MLKMSAGLGFTGQNLSIHEANSIILACRLEFKSIQIQSRPEQGPGVNSNAEEVEAGYKVLMLGWHPPKKMYKRGRLGGGCLYVACYGFMFIIVPTSPPLLIFWRGRLGIILPKRSPQSQ